MSVIAYLRVSTERQHIENQKDEIRRFAASRSLTIDRWVTETVSGKTQNKIVNSVRCYAACRAAIR